MQDNKLVRDVKPANFAIPRKNASFAHYFIVKEFMIIKYCQ